MVILGEGTARRMGIVYILMPIVGALLGFIFVVIFFWLYNVLAKRLGGIEFELTDAE